MGAAAALAAGFERFRAKWGEERAAGYRLPEPAAAPVQFPPRQEGRPRRSLCMIVRDEEANLPACLASVAGLFDDTVVVDTGSADRTREIAAAAGAWVVDFPWCDDFAAARNRGLEEARGEWVFWMDADDRLDEPDRRALAELLDGLPDDNAAYVLKCVCSSETDDETVVDHVRLFRRHPEARWEVRVHEQIIPALRRLVAEMRWAGVRVRHVGYADPEARRRKRQRDERLLGRDLRDLRDHPFVLFNLGLVCNENGRRAEALELFRRSLGRSHPADSIVRKLYALIAEGELQGGRPEEALAACREGLRYYPQDAELLYTLGLIHKERGEVGEAIRGFQAALDCGPGQHFTSLDAGVGGHKCRHQLGVLLCKQERWPEAEAQWHAALAARPGFLPAWLALAELYRNQGRRGDCEWAVAQLRAAPGGELALAGWRQAGRTGEEPGVGEG